MDSSEEEIEIRIQNNDDAQTQIPKGGYGFLSFRGKRFKKRKQKRGISPGEFESSFYTRAMKYEEMRKTKICTMKEELFHDSTNSQSIHPIQARNVAYEKLDDQENIIIRNSSSKSRKINRTAQQRLLEKSLERLRVGWKEQGIPLTELREQNENWASKSFDFKCSKLEKGLDKVLQMRSIDFTNMGVVTSIQSDYKLAPFQQDENGWKEAQTITKELLYEEPNKEEEESKKQILICKFKSLCLEAEQTLRDLNFEEQNEWIN